MPVPVFTTGEVLTAANMNAVGLWRVTGCTVTSAGGTAATASNGVITIGTGNTSVTVNNAFSSDYDNYLITINGESSNQTRTDLTMTLGASTASYYSQLVYGAYASTPLATAANNAAAWKWVGSCLTDSVAASITVMNPNRAEFTRYTAPWWADVDAGNGSGVHLVATAYTSFTIAPAVGTITGGQIRVYGYRK